MSSLTGLTPLNDYVNGAASDPARVALLLAVLADPDTLSSSGAATNPGTTGARGFLDEMSPAALTQLRVELTALMAAVS